MRNGTLLVLGFVIILVDVVIYLVVLFQSSYTSPFPGTANSLPETQVIEDDTWTEGKQNLVP